MTLFSVDQLIAHAVGDFMLQSQWMATTKTNKWSAAIAHVLVYGLPWLVLTRSPMALFFIIATHFVIDHWRLARYVCWAQNFLAPRSAWPPPWRLCMKTGYGPDKPEYLAVWLMIFNDQILHVLCNAGALYFFG